LKSLKKALYSYTRTLKLEAQSASGKEYGTGSSLPKEPYISLKEPHKHTLNHILLEYRSLFLSGKYRAHVFVTERATYTHFESKPPKNGKIALWPNTRVVKCKCTFHKQKTSTTIRAIGTIF